jgi:hypothetical protein
MNSGREPIPIQATSGRRSGHREANPDIHWPSGFTPDRADLFVHHETTINARRERVFRHLAEASRWPSWYRGAQNVRIFTPPTGCLQCGSSFEFDAFGMHLDATVGEFVPASRLGWFATGTDFDAYQTWLLVGIPPNGTCAVTEEVARGAVAIAMREGDPEGILNRHERWLSELKRLSQQ